MQIECCKCGYQWDTKSKHVLVSCPSCYKKVKVPNEKNIEVKKDDLKCCECGTPFTINKNKKGTSMCEICDRYYNTK